MNNSSKFLSAAAFALLLVSCSTVRQIPSDYPVLPGEFRNFKGELKSVTYQTSIPGPVQRRLYVYTPGNYETSGKDYPVLYLLHGARGDEASWITQGNILPRIDSLMESGSMNEMLVVFPNMNSYESESDYAMSRHKGALESFFEVDGAVETSFVKDVVSAVDSQFRTDPRKDARAIAGLSLGGMQAMYISASNPGTFGYVGILSAPLHSVLRPGPYRNFYDNLDSKIEAQFADPPLLYSVYVGKNDIYRSTLEKFCKRMASKGYRCTFHLDEGGHQWPQWLSFISDFIADLDFKTR